MFAQNFGHEPWPSGHNVIREVDCLQSLQQTTQLLKSLYNKSI